MKKLIMALMILTMAFAQGSFSFAYDGKDGDVKCCMKKNMMGGKNMGSMMKMMTERTVTATPDGGVVVLAGNKLTKYDKDLNVVKEADVKFDLEAMQKEMAAVCPMIDGKTASTEDQAEPA